ncbi:MAG: 3-deoxy-D-manno-octulosonic acid transferase [Flavobacterium sp.]|nr:3-deoxy-D-manno-octulosonic acid transferase [Flavobacterium sp.]
MLFIYNFFVQIASIVLKFLALFNPKLKLFVNGRKNVFTQISNKINSTDKTIWFHAASLGEYEQGIPVIEATKLKFPKHKVVLTFFSPSGFEIRKNNTFADLTIYLPLDTSANAKQFLKLVHPELVFFIKYEFWPNYLKELKSQNIKTYLISGIFRENQAFFKWYGGFYRNALQTFEYFFVQNESSKHLLQKLGFSNVKVSGDTRFDRVISILKRDTKLGFIEHFISSPTALGMTSTTLEEIKKTTIVIGSSWAKDEDLIVKYINNSNDNLKFIIAPHNINAQQIQELKNSIVPKTILFSEKENKDLASFKVFIIDTIGILTKIYSYADIAYVGGGFGNSGVHNILEPATFGIPIIIGPNYSHFAEVTALVNLNGCISISNQNQLNDALNLLINNSDERAEKGHICSTFVQMNKGATEKILNQISHNFQ